VRVAVGLGAQDRDDVVGGVVSVGEEIPRRRAGVDEAGTVGVIVVGG